MERLDASVDVDLFSKAVISVVGDEHHRQPVMWRVSPIIFLELPLHAISIVFVYPIAPLQGRRMPAARDKMIIVYPEKKGMRLFICRFYAIASDHAVFPVATIKKIIIFLFFF